MWLLLLLGIAASAECLQGIVRNDAGSSVESSSEADTRNTHRHRWKPRSRIYGWGADNTADRLISDSDREIPARDRPEWIQWKSTRGKPRTYHNPMHEELHARVFEESKAIVRENNEAFARGECSYELELNMFADFRIENCSETSGLVDSKLSLGNVVPPNFDWRWYIKLKPVEAQGDCKSCYHFAVVAAMEAHAAIKYNTSLDLSVQYLVDCSRDFGYMIYGCLGGFEDKVFEWLYHNNITIPSAAEYPYFAEDRTCRHRGDEDGIKVKQFVGDIRDEDTLKTTIAKVGPVITSFVVNNDLLLYKRGIYATPEEKPFNKTQGMHAVLTVGYGTEGGVDYWTYRNSWGGGWGELGYGKILRGVHLCRFSWYESCYPLV